VISSIPSGATLPSKIGQVLGLEAIARLMGMFMIFSAAKCTEKTAPGLTRFAALP
jgi:hypothetical protein